ncbi:MAG TPA: BamA/TamA family outer membrane protein [Myxococcales bacterium]|nr:BamA/TamA family outer membrane protein [Myxococcales bacterium]
MRRLAPLIVCTVLSTGASRAALAAEDFSGCPADLVKKLIPLPVYATLPNEGDTWGFLPVFLFVCEPDGRTVSIVAPSITWNKVIHWTATFRWFYYPGENQALTIIGSQSTHINSGVLIWWRDLPRQRGAFTDEVVLRWERSVFYRFFGIGPDTVADAETSYTRLRAFAIGRRGLNLGGNWNAGVTFSFDWNDVQRIGVPGLPLSMDVFPDAPGMNGATLLGQAIDVRYDTRPLGENSERGFFAGVGGGIVEGLAGSPTYAHANVSVRALWQEIGPLGGAARLDWSLVGSSQAPFYEQSSLGGAFLMRGFTQDRFIDQDAWTIEAEQRIRILQTHIYGVTADWRIDPFVAVGQVYRGTSEVFSNPRVAAGVGLRAWVRPNVLGRIDLANGGEGWKVYVEIGYPY